MSQGPVFALMGTWLVYVLRNREIIGLELADDMIRKLAITTAITVALCNSFPIDDWWNPLPTLFCLQATRLTCCFSGQSCSVNFFPKSTSESNDMLDHYAGHIWELELWELSLGFSLAPQCMLMFTWRRQHLKARMIMMMQWIHTFFWMKPFLSLDLSLYLHFALLSSSASTVWEYQLPPSFTFSIVLLVMKTGRSFADILTTYNLAQG